MRGEERSPPRKGKMNKEQEKVQRGEEKRHERGQLSRVLCLRRKS